MESFPPLLLDGIPPRRLLREAGTVAAVTATIPPSFVPSAAAVRVHICSGESLQNV